ncbi:3-mercaptopyruvate sulfurtransferase [Sphingomonas prati]|uniref:Sulfurtransferase n=1 Tax=Sphingomonas prati TaxID=1843237 RepID=A0A7W9BQV0_9SPHN|nr:3-mercaptopyruvate sulfurtransferase [Sphingomonas prati]MBB5728481.1 thiosulfate/3-mercaptopyruvate sulfurtransferase [Sphingomonas prati]GGE73428.1 sulfurtransferase [Sphingomonas prati]
MDALVSTEWLADAMGADDLRIVDATYFATDPARDPAAEYAAGHIPGAVFMDLGGLADPDSALPGMVPPAAMFAERMGSLGIGDGVRVVLYDAAPHRTSARAWWMLRMFGVRDVAILDGGLATWVAEGHPLATGGEEAEPGRLSVRQDETAVRDLGQMKDNLASGAEQVVDARSAARFSGAEADPRPSVASGHIPGSVNIPYDRLFEADGTWKRGDALKAVFDEAGVDLARPIVTTCGSGVTAAVLLFGAHLLGARQVALYDGSWSEWGADSTTPKAVS